jgi:RNA-directed DNA polymerase
MSTASAPVYEWKTIPWRHVERTVFKLQTRIYRAAQRGDVTAVHRLQRLLMQSWSAKCLAVRRVTQDNRGKQTAGVDGVKSLPPPQRLRLVGTLRLPQRPPPTRRVWIPKPTAPGERRPLGIPTLADRAAQALVKLGLEPEWEARFEPNSYGFRPGRSAHDAIAAIFNATRKQPKYVLDADIAQCFDRINHDALLCKLATTPTLRRVIRAWLRAGVMDGETLLPTAAGTPQGGVISPLLANIALHGLETLVTHDKRPASRPTLIRYADDFVVLHRDEAVIEQAHAQIVAWLAELGLTLKPSKTRIGHTLDPQGGHEPGFDFLGFTVRQFPMGRRHTGKTGGWHSRPLGFKTLIRPSKTAVHRHLRDLGAVVDQHKAAHQATLIHALNPRIRGWSRYYAAVCSKKTFAKVDSLFFRKLFHWAARRHPRKPGRWVARKYWRPGWTFALAANPAVALAKHAATPIRRYVKVRGGRSPYDGDWTYWSLRLRQSPHTSRRKAALLQAQQGRCRNCGLRLTVDDALEVDHIVPRAEGGTDRWSNQQLLHRHCHDQKTAQDLRRRRALAAGEYP